MQYDEQANGQEIRVKPNQEFEVSLPETRTAGYRWVIAEKGEPALQLLEETTIPNTEGVGGAGLHQWHFRAKSAGEAKVRLQYSRPWEKSAEPARTFELTVRVGS